MDSREDMNVNKFRIPNTKHFFKGGKCETFIGLSCVVYPHHYQHWWEGPMVVQRLLKCGKTILKEY